MSTAEQASLRDAVRSLLAKRSDSAAVRRAVQSPRGYDEALWRVLCEQIGVAALAIPEAFGGAGAGLRETHIVLEELGRTLTPSPMLGSAVLAAQLLLALDDQQACSRLLPGIADGRTVAAVCWADATGWHDGAVELVDGTLHGTAHYVLDGDTAHVLLVVTPSAIVEVAPDASGVTRAHTPSMDLTRRLATVRFDGVRGTRLDADPAAALRRAHDIVSIAQTAEQVGAMTRCLQMTVDYAKVRVQFGRLIGSFQALEHRMADLHVLVEAARSASYAALDGTIEPAVAAAYCAEAFFTVAAETIQLHGGIAITWEHDAHLYFKRAQAGTQLFGTPAGRRNELARAMGL